MGIKRVEPEFGLGGDETSRPAGRIKVEPSRKGRGRSVTATSPDRQPGELSAPGLVFRGALRAAKLDQLDAPVPFDRQRTGVRLPARADIPLESLDNASRLRVYRYVPAVGIELRHVPIHQLRWFASLPRFWLRSRGPWNEDEDVIGSGHPPVLISPLDLVRRHG